LQEKLSGNDALESTPETVNSDPYGTGWMIKIKVANVADYDTLLSSVLIMTSA
jgi:glycine cleavage system H protein